MKTILGLLLIIISSSGLLAGGSQACIESKQNSLTNRSPKLSRQEVLKRFYDRASKEEIEQFELFSKVADLKRRTRALEMVLFYLTTDELFQIGITEVIQSKRKDWGIAWAQDSPETWKAIQETLKSVNVSLSATSCDLGWCGWYVRREHFFQAQHALLRNTHLSELNITITNPLFSLE